MSNNIRSDRPLTSEIVSKICAPSSHVNSYLSNHRLLPSTHCIFLLQKYQWRRFPVVQWWWRKMASINGIRCCNDSIWISSCFQLLKFYAQCSQFNFVTSYEWEWRWHKYCWKRCHSHFPPMFLKAQRHKCLRDDHWDISCRWKIALW